jgi:hypothetical protein
MRSFEESVMFVVCFGSLISNMQLMINYSCHSKFEIITCTRLLNCAICKRQTVKNFRGITVANLIKLAESFTMVYGQYDVTASVYHIQTAQHAVSKKSFLVNHAAPTNHRYATNVDSSCSH